MNSPPDVDPYQLWLGLPPHPTRPNYYRLLGLRMLESDRAAIGAAADRAMARVRSFKPGAYARQWADLLDELKLAKATLLDSDKKAQYDASLEPATSGAQAAAASLLAGSLLAGEPTAAAAASEREATVEREAGEGEEPDGFAPSPSMSFAPPTATGPAERKRSGQETRRHLAAQLLGLDEAPLDSPPEEMAASKAVRHESGSTASSPASTADDSFDPMAPVDFDEPEEVGRADAEPAVAEAALPERAGPFATPAVEFSPETGVATRSEQIAQALASGVGASPLAQEAVAGQRPIVSPAGRPPAPKGNRRSGAPLFLMGMAATAAVVLAAAAYLALGAKKDGGKVAAMSSRTSPRSSSTKPKPSSNSRRELALRVRAAEQGAGEEIGAAASSARQAPLNALAEAAAGSAARTSAREPETIGDSDPPGQTPAATGDMPADPPGDTNDTTSQPAAPAMPEEAPPAAEPASEPALALTTEEASSLAKSLQAARAALTKKDPQGALAEIERAAPLARGGAAAQSLAQLSELASRSAEFWAAFERGRASLAPGEELSTGSTKVKILEATSEEIAYLVAGVRRKSAPRELPLGLAIAVAEKGMNDPKSAESLVIKGSPLAVSDNPALASQGRALWQEAEKLGASIGGLTAAVADRYEFANGQATASAGAGNPAAMAPATTGAAPDMAAALARARAALEENDVERAIAEIGKAERMAMDSAAPPEQQQRLGRLRLLADYLSQFWSIVGDSLAGLQVGDEIVVNNEPVIVVEADRDALEIRDAGMIRRFSRLQIPAGLAVALAQMRLAENDPATKMILAAVYAVQQDPAHHDTARRLWREAAASGADVGDLPRVLEDR